MIAFIDDHREAHGVEPICKVLPIAPSTYHAHAARRADPVASAGAGAARCRLMPEIARVFDENFEVYGVRKVWRQLQREGQDVARCTVERLMRSMGLQGVIRGKPVQDHDQRQGGAVPAGPRQPAVQGATAERAVGVGLHLCLDLGGLRLRRLRHRRLRPAHRRLAGVTHGACRASCSMRWSRPCMTAGRSIAAASSITATAAANTSRSNTPSAWPRPASSRRSAASATATTTRWPRRSTASTRPRSSIGAGRGGRFEAVEFATLEWVDWFNHRRLLEPIGNIPPAEAEERYYAMLEQPAMAA